MGLDRDGPNEQSFTLQGLELSRSNDEGLYNVFLLNRWSCDPPHRRAGADVAGEPPSSARSQVGAALGRGRAPQEVSRDRLRRDALGTHSLWIDMDG
jgi:hypothetical protein